MFTHTHLMYTHTCKHTSMCRPRIRFTFTQLSFVKWPPVNCDKWPLVIGSASLYTHIAHNDFAKPECGEDRPQTTLQHMRRKSPHTHTHVMHNQAALGHSVGRSGDRRPAARPHTRVSLLIEIGRGRTTGLGATPDFHHGLLV